MDLGINKLKLIKYDGDPSKRNGDFHNNCGPWSGPKAPKLDFLNISWSPYFAKIGDIIFVAAKSNLPLVLRRDGESYLFFWCLLANRFSTSGEDRLRERP